MEITNKKNQIKRIQDMEQLFDYVLEAIKELPISSEKYNNIQQAIATLSKYYSSNEWKQDYIDDEKGLLPKNLKRGILSEDGIWNLHSLWAELKKNSTVYTPNS